MMQNHVGWNEIALRLLLTVAGAALIGINRGEKGRAAGLRTTILVCLAASVSMIQVNLLLPLTGKASDSYIVMDLMRLPLGILTGVGFIGAGSILRRDNVVLGVTTAATLWFVTVMGLCFGGGQLRLGLAALAIALVVLWLLKPIEESWKQERHATLTVEVDTDGPTEREITDAAMAAGYKVFSVAVKYETGSMIRELKCEVKWKGRASEFLPPPFVAEMAERKGARKVDWQPAFQ
jgi:putative Mg2+ transporter-C (MgtC) family protein